MSEFIPLANRVLLKPIQPEPQSAIIIPEIAAKEDPTEAEVLAVGFKRVDAKGNPIDWTVKVGDRVSIVHYLGAPVPNSDLLVMREDDILGIIK